LAQAATDAIGEGPEVGQKGRRVVLANQGATDRTIAELAKLVPVRPASGTR
jgi:hypothetical protein